MSLSDNIIPAVESEQVEFKTSFNDEVIVSLVAFSNAKGGVVYVGVQDSGEVKGVQLGKETIQGWVNEVKNKTEPTVIPDVEVMGIDFSIPVDYLEILRRWI